MDTPTPVAHHSRRPAMVGAVIGSLALTGLVAGIGAVGAGAQSDDDPAITTAVITTVAEAPEDGLVFDDAEWEAYDTCMAEQLGDLWFEPDLDPFADLTDDEIDALTDAEIDALFEEFDAQFPELDEADFERYDEADLAGRQYLPEDVLAEIQAYEAYDQCLEDAGVFFDESFDGAFVNIDGPTSFSLVELGSEHNSTIVFPVRMSTEPGAGTISAPDLGD
ncbi:MAG: hypothetical protein ACE5GB_04780, partial [Acidimicrobiales bacterium]